MYENSKAFLRGVYDINFSSGFGLSYDHENHFESVGEFRFLTLNGYGCVKKSDCFYYQKFIENLKEGIVIKTVYNGTELPENMKFKNSYKISTQFAVEMMRLKKKNRRRMKRTHTVTPNSGDNGKSNNNKTMTLTDLDTPDNLAGKYELKKRFQRSQTNIDSEISIKSLIRGYKQFSWHQEVEQVEYIGEYKNGLKNGYLLRKLKKKEEVFLSKFINGYLVELKKLD